MEIVLSHLMGDLNLKMPSSVYSCGWSGVAAFKDSFVTCCTLLLLSLYTCRLTVTFLLSPILSGCEASSTVTACTWFILTISLSLQISPKLALWKFIYGFFIFAQKRLRLIEYSRRRSYESFFPSWLFDEKFITNHKKYKTVFFLFSRNDEKKESFSFSLHYTELLPKNNNKQKLKN